MAACSKISYTSKHDAHVAIERIVKGHRASKLAAYHCEHCGLWHLTHQKPKGKKPRTQIVTRYLAR